MRLAQKGDEVVMEVIDSGPGISVAQRERAFDAFYRIPGSPGDGGGLGFAMAREAAPAWAARSTLPHAPTARACVQVTPAALLLMATDGVSQWDPEGPLSEDANGQKGSDVRIRQIERLPFSVTSG